MKPYFLAPARYQPQACFSQIQAPARDSNCSRRSLRPTGTCPARARYEDNSSDSCGVRQAEVPTRLIAQRRPISSLPRPACVCHPSQPFHSSKPPAPAVLDCFTFSLSPTSTFPPIPRHRLRLLPLEIVLTVLTAPPCITLPPLGSDLIQHPWYKQNSRPTRAPFRAPQSPRHLQAKAQQQQINIPVPYFELKPLVYLCQVSFVECPSLSWDFLALVIGSFPIAAASRALVPPSPQLVGPPARELTLFPHKQLVLPLFRPYPSVSLSFETAHVDSIE